ncbi:MAG: TonB-dependent receptor [Saprospiraceae bacterium]
MKMTKLSFSLLSIFFLLCLSGKWTTVQAQTTDLKLVGVVADSTGTPLVGATIVLLQAQDSVMAAFALSDYEGRFLLEGLTAGQYFLQITYIGYGSFQKEITLRSEQQFTDLGKHNLSLTSHQLQAVEVTGAFVPILIKKDTIEYNARAFKTQPNAVVEDLLKKMPGIEVARDGSIKAQGETVEQLLVDGKPFFGSDPTIATKNLPADIVDKVQVFDHASEMASFSGIDDGEKEKTINLKLKAGKNQGVFGNVMAGYGTKGRYTSKFTANRFDQAMQLSFIGMANNRNERGFSIKDYLDFQGGLGNLLSGGEISLSSDDGLPLDFGNGEGITQTIAGGVNFNYDFNKKISLESSYFISESRNDLKQQSETANLLDEGIFMTTQASEEDILQRRHHLKAKLNYKIDSTQMFTLRANAEYQESGKDQMASSLSFDPLVALQNDGLQDFSGNGERLKWSSSIAYRKKLGRKARILSGKLDFGNGLSNSQNALSNTTRFFAPNQAVLFKNELIQEQAIDQDQISYGLNLKYLEPMGRKYHLGFELQRENFSKSSQNDFFDLPNPASVERNFNANLSSEYTQDYQVEQAGTSLRWNGKVTRFSAGVRYQRSILTGRVVAPIENDFAQQFYRWLPHFYLNHDIGKRQSIRLRYTTRLEEPSLNQLQPVVDNSDPLRIYRGNPNLRAAFDHDFSVRYSLMDQFSFIHLFVNGTLGYTEDKILQRTFVDGLLRQVIEPVNIDEAWRARMNVSYDMPFPGLPLKISLSARLNYESSDFFINEQVDFSQRWNTSYRLSVENKKKDWHDLVVGLRWNDNRNLYRFQQNLNQQYYDYTAYSEWQIYLKKAWVAEVSFEQQFYSAEAFGAAQNLSLLNLGFSKSILKNRLTFKLSAIDVFNQNVGIQRFSNYNLTQERKTNVIGRFFLLTATYKLSAFGNDTFGNTKIDQ